MKGDAMTQNKDLKRHIRSRMQKTGESYTAARAVIISRKEASSGAYAAPRKEWPSLAGVDDRKVKEKTGRTWAQWVDLLDKAGMHRKSHRDIASHISKTYGEVSSWWTQMVTVGYERIRGLRGVGQSRDGRYDANKSRTFAVDVAMLYRMFRDARNRKRWLSDGVTRIRTAIVDKSIRVDWHDGTQVNFFFVSKGPSKSTVAIQHAKLTSKSEVEKSKSFWDAQLNVLRDVLP